MYRIKNWSRYQHYKDRNPPWVKLHHETLYSRDWLFASDETKLSLVVCLIVASRHDGGVPNDPDLIQKMCNLGFKPRLDDLVESGFLVDIQDASNVLASACLETETETETETEREGASRFAPKDFKVTEASHDWAIAEGFSEQEVRQETDKFKDHEFPRPLKDFNRAWRNWMRKAKQWRPADDKITTDSEADRLGLIRDSGESDDKFQARLRDALVMERYG